MTTVHPDLRSLALGVAFLYGSAFAEDGQEPSCEATCPSEDHRPHPGGHVGVVVPLVTASDEGSSVVAGQVVGFPVGVGFAFADGWIFDIELVPFVDPSTREVSLLFHPGVVRPVGKGFAVGLRGGFEVGQQAVGFTPLLNKGFDIGGGKAWFVEAVAPVRFTQDKNGANHVVVAGAVHSGFGF